MIDYLINEEDLNKNPTN